jgi:hypothetical protein
MPNLDGGHYFLTILAPVRSDPVRRTDGSITAASHALREALACLPTAAQSLASLESQRPAPFARSLRTHFVRLVVLDQPHFNGRDPSNAIVQSLRKTDLLAHQWVDHLTAPWLVMAVDFDATDEVDHGLHGYLMHLWDVMQPELRAIFTYCHGFDARVVTAQDFAAYIRDCQVETTMPFNDYWTVPFAPPALSLPQIGAGAVATGAVLVALIWAGLTALGASLCWLWLGVPLAVVLALLLTYAFVMQRGARPFPAAPDADLASVLKALYLQQRFAQFAGAHQLDPAAGLHQAFGDFLKTTRPADLAGPTRVPGAIAQEFRA